MLELYVFVDRTYIIQIIILLYTHINVFSKIRTKFHILRHKWYNGQIWLEIRIYINLQIFFVTYIIFKLESV